MDIVAERLADARKRRALTQKAAAAKLGVSQALLSHYEKGVRACGNDFLARAARFYDVSADFLLGLSDQPHAGGEMFTPEELPLDSEPGAQTIYRALVLFAREAEKLSPKAAGKVLAIYELSLYRLLTTVPNNAELGFKRKDIPLLSQIAESSAMRALSRALIEADGMVELPLCVRTALAQTETSIRAAVASVAESID